MLAMFCRDNISRNEKPRYRYRIVLKQGTCDYCLEMDGALELLSSLRSAIESAETMQITDKEAAAHPPTHARDEIAGAVSRGYCSPKNRSKVIDPDLIEAITDEVIRQLSAV